jgi:hypothetical protein
VLCEAGDGPEAGARLETLLERPEQIRYGFLRRVHLALLSEVVERLGHTDAAARFYRWLEAELRHGRCVIVGPNAFYGAVERYLGLLALTLGRSGDAVHHQEIALDVHDQMRALGWATRSRYDLARALLVRAVGDDAQRAHALLDQASSVARDLGMRRLLDELDDLRRSRS